MKEQQTTKEAAPTNGHHPPLVTGVPSVPYVAVPPGKGGAKARDVVKKNILACKRLVVDSYTTWLEHVQVAPDRSGFVVKSWNGVYHAISAMELARDKLDAMLTEARKFYEENAPGT